MFFEPVYIPRALNTGTCLRRGDPFYPAGLHRNHVLATANTGEIRRGFGEEEEPQKKKKKAMVWGGITMTVMRELNSCQGNVTGLYNRDNVIESIALTYPRRLGNAFIFQDDTARAHRARDHQDHLQFRTITTLLLWSARFPDLSPNEHLWDILGRRVLRRPHKPQVINELADALQEEWHQIPKATTGRLISSMRSRCLACLAANGGLTRH